MNNEQKLAEAKKRVDSLIGLPNTMLRKGVARAGDPLTGIVDYNYKLLRDKDDGRYLAYIEWVDLDGSGNRVVLPHEVVTAILRANESLIKQSRKEGARKAVETRKAKAIQQAENILNSSPL
jgi:hypothetical protein